VPQIISEGCELVKLYCSGPVFFKHTVGQLPVLIGCHFSVYFLDLLFIFYLVNYICSVLYCSMSQHTTSLDTGSTKSHESPCFSFVSYC